jgi:hypothetical protein
MAAAMTGLALTLLILAAPFVSGPGPRPVAKRDSVRIVRLIMAPEPPAAGTPEADPSAPALSDRSTRMVSFAPAALPRAPAALPPFQPEQAIAPAAEQSRAAASASAEIYAYLTTLRRIFQAAIVRDGRLRSGAADAAANPQSSHAALWLWIAPTGRLMRADEPAATGRMGRVLIDIAMNLGHLPAPPEGLPQPVEIGLDGAEASLGSLQDFLAE